MNAKDILKYEHELKEAGVPANQAEIHAKSMAELIDSNLATKQDVELLRKDLEALGNKITIKVGSIVTVAIGILLGLQHLLGH